ncbi:hypothetical protein ABFS82_02G101900 [Erythranthe guttata]|uniref:Major facilitator superfamily (MFS) profile domain-containing protein n=1 Tax=Erythranthe guttata TaxID=4155 RepID=A0A022Q219_ERYGU|nr:PREDICTED: high affinity nitrate transporter 2.7-like [Erythranthe guttata]XP_012855142.1 PREDICTED: high affinity nitrate transporter 2.7-like [Erythranthe guttata]EYU22672.1 hypothetical protein MIMGU_mgv1a005911mg [Erythranthe guttata]|eukprot:XP_012855109.1 PREDICTED: high affinity nitrate transporter 2.7-like [Erythranthe guttata]
MNSATEQQASKTTDQTTFPLQVDSEHKATVFRPFSISPPHMRAFHLAWISLFACFFSTFSIPSLLPAIRQDLHLTAADVGTAGAASFCGSIFSRLAMGPACDMFGPRAASAAVSLLTAPAVLAVSFASTAKSFILVRFLIGISLANFVSCQFWMASMFSGEVVGAASGVASGWASAGSGLTQLVMPSVYYFLTHIVKFKHSFAWRAAFTVPALLQILTALAVLAYGQDLPDGKYKRIPNNTNKNYFSILFNGLKNYRGWVLGLTYGFCFGVELTTDNIIAQYFYDRFGVGMEAAGAIAASFGFANIVTRPAGGVVSDAMGRRYGMRGRLWSLWAAQTVAAVLCVGLGRIESLWGSVLVMCCFSVFVQAASGLTFGVVPFVSKRSLGVISGMTGSGGTLGAVVTQLLLFSGSNNNVSTQKSISLMGILMFLSTLPLTLLYFPHSGGMFCGPSHHPNSEQDYYNLLS